MKKYLIIILLLIIGNNLFQSQKFVVQYEYTKHINKDSLTTIKQNTYLNVENDQSLFFSEAPYLADSIVTADQREGKKTNFKGLPYDALNCFIKKNISNKEITYYSDEFPDSDFTYIEKPDLKWTITNDKKIIMGYYVQKAEAKYAGRNYIAYFTTQIPVQDGPYKFFGLPGLILELFDTKEDHHFIAVGISKQKKMSVENIISNKKYIKTTRSKFLKTRKNYVQAPLQRMFELMNATQIFEKKDSNGNTVDIRKLANDMQKKMIKEYESENRLELQN